jgi:hypothetical protein
MESRYEERFHLKKPDTELISINMALSRIFPWHRQTRKDPVRKKIAKANSMEFVWICGLFLSSTFGIIFFEGLVQPPNNPQNAL